MRSKRKRHITHNCLILYIYIYIYIYIPAFVCIWKIGKKIGNKNLIHLIKHLVYLPIKGNIKWNTNLGINQQKEQKIRNKTILKL